MPVQSIESARGAVRITAGGTLTLRDMTLIRDALSQGQGDAPITLDLHGMHSLQSPVLLALATAIAGQGVRVQVLGLDPSSDSLLRRLGIGLPRDSTSSDTTPRRTP